MPNKIQSFLNHIEDDLDKSEEPVQTAQTQAEELVKSMYSYPKQSILDVSDNRKYTQVYLEKGKIPEVTDELLCRAYICAKESLNVSDRIMSSKLNIGIRQYQKLLDNPKFAMAVQCGILDGRQEIYDDLTTNLYKLATGRFVVEEISTETTDIVTMDGIKVGQNTKTTVKRRRVPPDAKIAQRLLSRIDPSWKQTEEEIDNNLQIAKDLKVTEDVTMAVDPTKLPPDILRYLISSNTRNIDNINRVGGTVDNIMESMPEQEQIHKSLKDINSSLLSTLPDNTLHKDSVVTPEQLDVIIHPKKKRGRPKKEQGINKGDNIND